MTNLHSDKIKTANLHTAANHIYTNTKLRKLLVPIIIEQLLASLMGTVDTMMVSNVGSAAISAVSLVDSINILVIQALSAPVVRFSVHSIWEVTIQKVPAMLQDRYFLSWHFCLYFYLLFV